MAGGDEYVIVEPLELFHYNTEMLAVFADHSTGVTNAMAEIGPLISTAFLDQTSTAGHFAEGGMIGGMMLQRLSDMKNFMNDVVSGITCIGSAAMVCGASYNNADVRSAQSMDVVKFAFGDTAAVPSGYQYDKETYSDKGSRAPGVPMAMIGDERSVVHAVDVGGVTYRHYADGSYSVTRTSAAKDGIRGTTSETYITDQNGNVVSRTTKTEGTIVAPANSTAVAGCSTVVTTEQRGTDPPVTTTSVTMADGSVQVSVTRVNADGEQETTTSVVAAPDDTAVPAGTEGPVERARRLFNMPGAY